MTATYRSLDRLARPLARLSRTAWATLALGAGALLLGAAAWAARLGWFDAPYWVLVAWAAALAAAASAAWMAWRAEGRFTRGGVARWLEDRGGWRRGALTAFLEPSAAGTSEMLLAAADTAQAADVDARGRAALDPVARPIRGRALAAAAVLLVGVGAVASAGPVTGTAAALWHPGRAWRATTAPVTIRVDESAVDRGASVDLELEAIGRREATLWLRSTGEAWRRQTVELDSLGRGTRTIGPLRSDLFARLTSGNRSSDTVLVQVRLPVFLGTLDVTARYPAYLNMEDEPVPTGGDTIIVPADTRLETEGAATAELRSAAWSALGRTFPLDVSGTGFDGSMVPSASAEYRLALVTAAGSTIGGDTVRLPIRVLPDSAPRVEVPVPGADTVAPASLRLPLVIDARDDHGLRAVTVESRRISRLGRSDSVRREAVALPAGRPDRAILAYDLDLGRLGVVPGDTLRYWVRATDYTPGTQSGRSREYVVRIPTEAEVRAAQREATADVRERLDSIAARSRQAERQTEDVARDKPRSAADGSGNDDALSFEQAKKAEAAAQSQEQLMQEAEELKEALAELQENAKAAGLDDPEWQARMEEIREQLDRALSPELKEKLAELQRSLKDLSAERTQDALEQLAEAQKELREALERSRELFRRAALEGDMANLAEESKDLAREQREWSEKVPGEEGAEAAAEEKALAERADSLAAALERTAKEAGEGEQQEALEQAAQQAQEAAEQMRSAEQSAKSGQKQKAQQSGQQASKKLEPLGKELDEARESMQEEWREEIEEALDHALAEASRLTQREQAVQQRFKAGEANAQVRAEQAALEEGVQRLLEQVKAASGKNALVTPQIAAAMASALNQMGKAREAVSTAAPNSREASERSGQAIDALNAGAYQLMRAKGDVSGSGSGSGMAEAMEQMAKMAGQQGQLGKQGAGLLPMAGTSGAQQQLQALGAQQRALAEQLERLRAQGNSPGAGEMANEAKDLARRLEAGRIDRQTVERQERLFRRMLDAGRTLQGEEKDEKKERESTTATGDSVRLPAALRARLLDENDRPRVPSWEELQRLSPEERRLVVDYFRRLTEATPR